MTKKTVQTALIQRCQEGDRSAWQQLIESYGSTVYSLLRYKAPHDRIDDIYQDVWLSLFEENARRLKEYNPRFSFVTYLKILTMSAPRKTPTLVPEATHELDTLGSGSISAHFNILYETGKGSMGLSFRGKNHMGSLLSGQCLLRTDCVSRKGLGLGHQWNKNNPYRFFQSLPGTWNDHHHVRRTFYITD